jgi:Domain of unknown function (DUF3825)
MTEEAPAEVPQAAPGQVDPTHVPKTAVLRHMNDFASLGARLRYERLQRLATLTNDAGEHWDYPAGEGDEAFPVLSRYVDYTFRRVHEQDRVVYSTDGQWAAFHTGLLNAVYKEIFGVFQRSRDARSPWFLQDFVTDDDRRLSQFRDLPIRATYFDNPADLVYDTRRRLVWTDHTLMDREIRFPESLQGDDPDSVERRRRAIHAAVRPLGFIEVRSVSPRSTASPQLGAERLKPRLVVVRSTPKPLVLTTPRAFTTGDRWVVICRVLRQSVPACWAASTRTTSNRH